MDFKRSDESRFVNEVDNSIKNDPAANRDRVMTIKINDHEFELIKKLSGLKLSSKTGVVKQLIAEEARRLGLI
jgi:hypothetical protein